MKQSNDNFRFIFSALIQEETAEYDRDIEELYLIKELIQPHLCNWDGKPQYRSSLVKHEIDMMGWQDFLGEWYQDILACHSQNWIAEGHIWYSQDYWGEWDGGTELIVYPANRNKRAEWFKAHNIQPKDCLV